jgi:hypothetical protein
MVIKNTPVVRSLFEKVYREGLGLPQLDVSDQKLLNHELRRTLSRNELVLLDRVKFNSFPAVLDSRYRSMGLPVGDEIDSSLVVHFAGDYPVHRNIQNDSKITSTH